jgi:hypothetical protein
MRNILSILVIFFFYTLGFSTDYTAINSGPFNDANTWDGNGVPPTVLPTIIMDGDRVIINAGVTVDIDINVIFIINNGQFINNGTVNLTPSIINNANFFLNGITGVINIDNNSTLLNSSGIIENQGIINNNGNLISCLQIENVTGKPAEPAGSGLNCMDDGNPETNDYWDGNCNCIHECYPQISISGVDESFNSLEAIFSAPLSLTGSINGVMELADPAEACGVINNIFNGNVAVIDRGSCSFVVKILTAQEAGASAVIVCNNTPGGGLIRMGGTPSEPITIPAVFMSYEDCEVLKLNAGSEILIDENLDCIVPIPSLSQWGIIALSMIMLIFGLVVVRHRKVTFA